ncbi:ABC transporter permease [Clostridium gasigenes]|uniref:ABC transporter permease n=1 Tax=Clostridium gasigenes TaxID=94869 RepID=UPI001C0C087C|nr:ABC transporter permease [Clostridium gasigenes]MBU3105624.1 ABC transporter permease [Clostridium gasigenes]MBU3109160.1 ABC transporter permease [Clostridium gasigenes]
MPFFIGILEQGLIIAIAALGVYITYTILDFPDLSVDGTFSLGAAVSIVAIINNVNPFVSLIFAFIAGALGGLITGILHVKFKITNLLSGILVMIGLYSINLRIMGKANLPIFDKASIFSSENKLMIIIIITIIIKIAMDLIFKTKFGFILKATGDNETLVTTLAVSTGKIKIIALMFSNGLVALSGGIMAQYQNFSDISMGTGLVIMALAAIILGQSVFKSERVLKATTIVIIGAILYKLSIGLALKAGFPPTDVKLITSLIVIIAIVMNNNKFSSSIGKMFKKRGALNA